MNAAEAFAKATIENYDNPLQSSSIDVPAHVESYGYAQRYKAFRWRPNRPMVRETESRDTMLRHGGPRRGGRGIHTAARIHPFQEEGRDSHDG
jgi:hypothetical protein